MSEPSILRSVKKVIGVDPDDLHWDVDLLMHINTAFSVLAQLGVCADTFRVNDDSVTWDDVVLDGILPGNVPTYVYQKTRLLFDPPAMSFHINAIESSLREIEWRLETSTSQQ